MRIRFQSTARAACAVAAAGLLTLAGIAVTPAYADGFARPGTLQFRLSTPGLGISRESLRAGLNAASAAQERAAAAASGSGEAADVRAQSQSNMANVIQVTENYEIILNGDGNTVTTRAGGVTGTQDGTGVSQVADNTISAQSSNSTSSYSATASGGNAQAAGTVLNP
jgi:hypothetical protein